MKIVRVIAFAAILLFWVWIPSGCGSISRSGIIRRGPSAQLALPRDIPPARQPDDRTEATAPDSLIIRNIDGKDFILMRTIRDENGETVASQVLEAARVCARFRNVAERHGRIDLEFQIIVPENLQQSRWQLRYTPTMFILGDSLQLDKVLITGGEYRKKQLRGYQQYERFLGRIINDSSAFIDSRSLEIFIERNIPELYAFRNDSSFVSDESFCSVFGVDRQQALIHYTRHHAVLHNEKLKSQRGRRFNRYVKAAIVSDGIRLDTVITAPDGDLIYNYVQTITTRPRLKKVDIVLDGEIYEQNIHLCSIARSQALNFYISSLSSLADDSPKYITRIIERLATATSSYDLRFRAGHSNLEPELDKNGEIINEIKHNIRAVLCNDVFVIDSICISAGASPEGSAKSNRELSRRRSGEVVRYFNSFTKAMTDSIRRDKGIVIDIDDDMRWRQRSDISPSDFPDVHFKAYHCGENWDRLAALAQENMSGDDLAGFNSLMEISDADKREKEMSLRPWYKQMRETLYPVLRNVDFSFRMHRRGMVKDTIHTTVIDSLYMEGVQAIKERDYDKAISILRPYGDYNTAVAYCAKDYNHSAIGILLNCPRTDRVDYLLALLYSRTGDTRTAARYYLSSCSKNPSFIHRGNLDPEIAAIIRLYNIQF